MKEYPFLSLRTALLILRIVTPLLFMAHAAVRIIVGSIPQFATFMGGLGFPAPLAIVWAITITELVAGAMVIAGLYVRLAASALAAIAFVGIILIHMRLGWFVGEHGTGGSEYSVALLVMLLVLMANDRETTKP